MKITIKEISKAAGVSIATVSRVLTSRDYVKPETRQIVEKTIRKLGYQYRKPTEENQNKDKIILILCGDINSQVYVNYIKGITDFIEPKGYRVFIADSRYNAKKDEDYLEYALKQNYAGIVMLSAIWTDDLINLIKKTSKPIVFVNRYLRSIDTDIVCIDNYRGGYIATEFLIKAGHKHIVHLCGPENSTTCNDRMRGYMDCMKDNGLEVCKNDIFFGNLQLESGYEFAQKIISNRRNITAVFSANDIMASALVEELSASGIQVPEDISVICSDNTLAAVKGKVKLTCVSYDDRLIGNAAGELLFERLNNSVMQKKKIVYCPVITARDSVKKPGSSN